MQLTQPLLHPIIYLDVMFQRRASSKNRSPRLAFMVRAWMLRTGQLALCTADNWCGNSCSSMHQTASFSCNEALWNIALLYLLRHASSSGPTRGSRECCMHRSSLRDPKRVKYYNTRNVTVSHSWHWACACIEEDFFKQVFKFKSLVIYTSK